VRKGDRKSMNRLKEKYLKEVQPKLQQELGLKNKLTVPALKKIVVSMGLGEAKENAAVLEKVQVYLAALAGQKGIVTHAKKSIATFKLGKGQPIGMMVTLRGDKMYVFLDKLMNIVLPKVRDFRGVSAREANRRCGDSTVAPRRFAAPSPGGRGTNSSVCPSPSGRRWPEGPDEGLHPLQN